jgi:hypothetical protein
MARDALVQLLPANWLEAGVLELELGPYGNKKLFCEYDPRVTEGT